MEAVVPSAIPATMASRLNSYFTFKSRVMTQCSRKLPTMTQKQNSVIIRAEPANSAMFTWKPMVVINTMENNRPKSKFPFNFCTAGIWAASRDRVVIMMTRMDFCKDAGSRVSASKVETATTVNAVASKNTTS